jgi:hypothetical protein
MELLSRRVAQRTHRPPFRYRPGATLEARLLPAEVDSAPGRKPEAVAAGRSIEADARRMGFVRVANRAAAIK